MMFLGGMLGGLIFGHLSVARLRARKGQCDWIFSSQRIADYRCFLRMRFEPDKLTIYPIRLDSVPARGGWRWRRKPGTGTSSRGAEIAAQAAPDRGADRDPSQTTSLGPASRCEPHGHRHSAPPRRSRRRLNGCAPSEQVLLRHGVKTAIGPLGVPQRNQQRRHARIRRADTASRSSRPHPRGSRSPLPVAGSHGSLPRPGCRSERTGSRSSRRNPPFAGGAVATKPRGAKGHLSQ